MLDVTDGVKTVARYPCWGAKAGPGLDVVLCNTLTL